MTNVRALGTAAAAAVLSLLFAGQAPAQSLLSASGLGTPLEPVDARARALGGLPLGLPDAQMSLVNPAAAVGLPAAGLTVTFQSDQVSGVAEGQDQDFGTARFPVVQVAFPIGTRWVTTVGYAAVLDQNWAVENNDSVFVTGQQLSVLDRFRSSGGVARLRGGVGYHLMPRLDVGVAVDLYTGALRDTVYRVFTEGGIAPSITGSTYEWQGLGFSAGARWRGSALSVSAAVTAGGALTAAAQDSGVASKDYSLPVQVDVGGSARVAQQALVAISARWQGWGAADEDVSASGGARDATQVTGGFEYEALRFLGRPVPLRVGGRYAQLPFRFNGAADFVDERAATAGIGMVFGGGAASLDLSGERGWRGGDTAGLDESFWRLSLSLSLLGR